MNLISKYNFREKNFGPNFGGENLVNTKKLIDSGVSFTTLSMPMVGVSYFLRYLVSANLYDCIFLDIYSLPSLTKYEFWKAFLRELGANPASKSEDKLLAECHKLLQQISQNRSKVVIIFNRFDQLRREFDLTFLANLRSLRNVAPDKIVIITTSNKPLYELAPQAISGANLNFYSQFLYFKPYSGADLKKLLVPNPTTPRDPKKIAQLIKLSGGHAQLLQVLINSQKQDLLADQFVKLQFKTMLDSLSYHQRKIIQNLSLGKEVKEVDDYLLGVGMVTRSVILSDPERAQRVEGESKDLSKFELFTPLFAEYIKANLPMKLPAKEAKLFKLLRKHQGQVVPKDEIFSHVWQEDPEKGTDWALDALIYRLRKNPSFSSQYVIESHKKQGFSLIQI